MFARDLRIRVSVGFRVSVWKSLKSFLVILQRETLTDLTQLKTINMFPAKSHFVLCFSFPILTSTAWVSGSTLELTQPAGLHWPWFLNIHLLGVRRNNMHQLCGTAWPVCHPSLKPLSSIPLPSGSHMIHHILFLRVAGPHGLETGKHRSNMSLHDATERQCRVVVNSETA